MVVYGNQDYCTTAKVCTTVGISKATLFRWIRNGEYPDVQTRDRNGWRLFTKEEVEKLRNYAMARRVEYY